MGRAMSKGQRKRSRRLYRCTCRYCDKHTNGPLGTREHKDRKRLPDPETLQELHAYIH